MQFRPLNTYNWDYQGTGFTNVAVGDTADMPLDNHCWRFAARVSPGRDTNGALSPGDGNTTFDGNLKY